MTIDREKPEDILENSPHRGEKTDADGSRSAQQDKRRSQGPLPGEDENNLDDRTDSNDR